MSLTVYVEPLESVIFTSPVLLSPALSKVNLVLPSLPNQVNLVPSGHLVLLSRIGLGCKEGSQLLCTFFTSAPVLGFLTSSPNALLSKVYGPSVN